jgi:choline dehydrogenase-like flavoprotein
MRTADVLIVGSGAGGAPLAVRLSEAGFRVIVLEKGPRYARADFRHDELLDVADRGFFVPDVQHDPHILLRHDGSGASPERTTLGWTACCVGGGTAHMGGALYRFHPHDFTMQSRFGAFEALADWAYGYDDLEPYYVQAEWAVGVSGDDDAGGLHPARRRPLPMPPVEIHPLAAAFDEASAEMGLHPFTTPRAINSVPYDGRPACEQCDFCGGFGCPVGARGGTHEALIPRAERTGRCEVVADAMVREITVSSEGRATGCIYLDRDGAQHAVSARVVCVCCSAVETARLLLASRSAAFPEGLANGSGLVGRNLQFHVGSAGRGRFRYDRHPEKGLRTPGHFLGRSIADHYFLPEAISDLPKGGLLRYDMERLHPLATAQRIARSTGLWGKPLRDRLREYFNDCRSVEFEVFQDFIPNRDTFVELDPEVTDRWGLPVARIHLREVDHHRTAGEWLLQRGLEVLERMGADELVPRAAGYVSHVMVHGTCRAGRDPAPSVLDEYCRAHEVPNLFVADGSFMPTSGGAPSTLTILANSFRAADFIADRAATGDLARHQPIRRVRAAAPAAV